MNEIHLCVIILNRDQWIIYVVFVALVAILFWELFGNYGRGPYEELLPEILFGPEVQEISIKEFYILSFKTKQA